MFENIRKGEKAPILCFFYKNYWIFQIFFFSEILYKVFTNEDSWVRIQGTIFAAFFQDFAKNF